MATTTSGSATTPSGPAASAVVQELDINLQEWDDVGSESDMTVVPASSSAVTKNKNITKIVVDSEANEEVNADEEESEWPATKAKGRDKNKTVKTPPASPTKRARRGPAKGKGKDRSA
ncbi:hypothetical protein H9P43_006879 [Blastocladiella emersonii ATCC 22665]|nr:hypothetical protein H9P43_006879 [Blastocladiella emersonii ATCC 22665]